MIGSLWNRDFNLAYWDYKPSHSRETINQIVYDTGLKENRGSNDGFLPAKNGHCHWFSFTQTVILLNDFAVFFSV